MSLDEEKRQKITAIMIIEVMGKPREHLVETLEKISTDIGNEKNVKIIEKKINEPKEIEKKKGFFTNYVEVEVELDDPLQLSILMFKYMPAHIEIIEPESLKMSNIQYADILNELTRRLHQYDGLLRVMQMERNAFAKKAQENNPKKE